ncbi:MAG: metallophosphoesterase [Candidatus Aminicenantes bacterium]|jgi:UDP-2,3-diacylglucosamine pyrophosphatase LpxH|nr:metallophosphoesterase [Candidatus Aminicenantes bacterium]
MIKTKFRLFPLSIIFLVLLAFFTILVSPLISADLKMVVIGDTSPEFFSKKSPFFKDMISKINSLQPDVVIHLGDMIAGYGLRRAKSQWDEFDQLVSQIQAPFYRVPGNHDIYSRKSLEIYLQRYKKTYLSFDLKGYHFIILWDIEDNRLGHISQEQYEWLKADLTNSDQWKGAFVFVHVPLWTKTSKYVHQADKDFWMNKIHPLLVQHKVLAVFAGHYHRFGPTRKIDGITYYISGGGGPRLNKLYIKHGGDNHFLLVEASGQQLQVQVIFRDKILTPEQADVLKEVLK